MKILVTGGAGFIGSNIVDAYVADGHEVTVIDDLSTGRRENLNPRARFVEMDIGSPDAREFVAREKPDVLSHHAAQIDVRKSVADPLFDLQVNVLAFVGLLEAAKDVKRVILASSGGTVYGLQKYFPADEKHPTWPVCPYAINKVAGEHYLNYYGELRGLKWVVLRYGNVYGPRQNPHGEAGVVAIFTKRMLAGNPVTINGDGRQIRDYVFVDDVVAANRLALTDAARGVYNVSTGVETDVVAIAAAVRKAAGTAVEVTHGPAKSGDLARCSIDSTRIREKLGWRPRVSLDDGILRTVEWFRAHPGA
jgi:UDP-glucose 4-epimerase